MSRPVVGIFTSIAPASWGPWVDRPSMVAPAALGEAVQRAGAIAVLLAPDPELEHPELLGMLDRVVVFDDAKGVEAVLRAARERGLEVLVLDGARVTPVSPVEDFVRELAGLL